MFIENFFLTMADTITCQNIDLSYWINVYCLNDIKFLEVRYMFVYFFHEILSLTFICPCIASILKYVEYFILGNSPASEFYMPTFRNTLSLPSS